jgi:predicted ArsR family transcriptional regulator
MERMSGRSPTDVPAADRRYVALAVASRRRLLEVLRGASEPLGAGELAAAVGLHVTTARAHLRVLEAAGLVVRAGRPPSGPGRPRQFYAPVSRDGLGEGHRELAELLAGALGSAGAEGRRQAEAAGRRWARYELPDASPLSPEEAVAALVELFGRLGFAPRPADADPAGSRFALDRCPFRDVARAHPEIVCAVHLGLLRGVLADVGQAGLAASAQLQPFVAPELCMVGIPA